MSKHLRTSSQSQHPSIFIDNDSAIDDRLQPMHVVPESAKQNIVLKLTKPSKQDTSTSRTMPSARYQKSGRCVTEYITPNKSKNLSTIFDQSLAFMSETKTVVNLVGQQLPFPSYCSPLRPNKPKKKLSNLTNSKTCTIASPSPQQHLYNILGLGPTAFQIDLSSKRPPSTAGNLNSARVKHDNHAAIPKNVNNEETLDTSLNLTDNTSISFAQINKNCNCSPAQLLNSNQINQPHSTIETQISSDSQVFQEIAAHSNRTTDSLIFKTDQSEEILAGLTLPNRQEYVNSSSAVAKVIKIPESDSPVQQFLPSVRNQSKLESDEQTISNHLQKSDLFISIEVIKQFPETNPLSQIMLTQVSTKSDEQLIVKDDSPSKQQSHIISSYTSKKFTKPSHIKIRSHRYGENNNNDNESEFGLVRTPGELVDEQEQAYPPSLGVIIANPFSIKKDQPHLSQKSQDQSNKETINFIPISPQNKTNIYHSNAHPNVFNRKKLAQSSGKQAKKLIVYPHVSAADLFQYKDMSTNQQPQFGFIAQKARKKAVVPAQMASLIQSRQLQQSKAKDDSSVQQQQQQQSVSKSCCFTELNEDDLKSQIMQMTARSYWEGGSPEHSNVVKNDYTSKKSASRSLFDHLRQFEISVEDDTSVLIRGSSVIATKKIDNNQWRPSNRGRNSLVKAKSPSMSTERASITVQTEPSPKKQSKQSEQGSKYQSDERKLQQQSKRQQLHIQEQQQAEQRIYDSLSKGFLTKQDRPQSEKQPFRIIHHQLRQKLSFV